MSDDIIVCSRCKGKFPKVLTGDLYDEIVCYECRYEYREKYAKEIGYNDRL